MQGHGYRKSLPLHTSGNRDTSYLECLYDQSQDLWHWTLTICPDSQLFNSNSTECYTPGAQVSCNQVDARGVSWLAEFDEWAVQDCGGDGIVGMASWYCDGDLMAFNSSQPDRSGCQEEWVGETEEMVGLSLNNSFNINIQIFPP